MAINNNIIPGFDEEKDDSLKISLDKVSDLPNCIRIYLNGYIDTYNSNFFQKKIAKVIEAGFINIIFVNHVDLTFATLYKIPLAIPEWRHYNDYGALLRLLWVW